MLQRLAEGHGGREQIMKPVGTDEFEYNGTDVSDVYEPPQDIQPDIRPDLQPHIAHSS